ncbi:MAG TPA: carboxypeptidase regulatory-like domain-containing protein [Terriglobia bacterium]|nr:carboxypeptidase regulatory-like domain-containing protein [Terriglobia bacterium]
MISKTSRSAWVLALSIAFFSAQAWAQNFNATLSGRVIDSSGAVIPGAVLTLTSDTTRSVATAKTGSDGLYTFPNLIPAPYTLQVSAKGFRNYVQHGIVLLMNQQVTNNVTMTLGAVTQVVNVSANASPLNFENATVKGAITKQQLENLPLEVEGSQLSAAEFVKTLPGVASGGAEMSNVEDSYYSFDGGQTDAEAAVLDGVSMIEGGLSQSGFISLGADFPISPYAVGEISVLTSNYDPQYGQTNGAIIVATTQSGADQWHGGSFFLNRNSAFNARPFGGSSVPPDNENDGGGYVGGPLKHVPGFWSGRKKSYVFVNFEFYRSLGATTFPFLTVPSAAMRNGDFSAWPYPIYNPDTTVANPNYNSSGATDANNEPYLRQQFSGNVIPSSAMAGSLAQGWLKWAPLPNRPGLTDNYQSPWPLASALNADTDQWDVRGDQYIGDKDHVMVTWHYRGTLPYVQHDFPIQIDTNNTRIPNYSEVERLNYDHTFSPTLLNHFAIGYLDLLTGEYNSDTPYVSDVPAISGVYAHTLEPAISFQEYSPYGGNASLLSTRPTWIVNDMVDWVHGAHTFELGGTYGTLAYPEYTAPNAAGSYYFSDLNTGLLGIPSGNSMASFLLGDVSSANASFYSLATYRPQSRLAGLFAGDTWKTSRKLTVNYGMRWDLYTPSSEAKNQSSWFDPNMPNPGAGNRLGALVFAGNAYGAASTGESYPEQLFYGAMQPRVGIAYALTPNTVLRAGWGIFFQQEFYPGWNDGIGTSGFNVTPSFSSSLGGLQPAFLLQNGLPQNFLHPPDISLSALNGEDAPEYRPSDADEEPHSMQWNLTIDHQFTQNLHVSAGYVANHSSRLLSQQDPLNVLNPSLLSLGTALDENFQPGQTVLDGVAAPYPGWAQQMTGCPPSLAQALLPYPQYCGGIYGVNENVGWSNYNSLQVTAEKRFAHGLVFDANYTWSKWISTGALIQTSQEVSPISPFQMNRNYAPAEYEVPQIFNLTLVYDLPVGRGNRFMNRGGVLNDVLGGWQLSSIVTLQSGAPLTFSSSLCNVPSQFDASCLPSLLPGANPFLRSKSNWNGAGPLFNVNSFTPASSFEFNFGEGPSVSNIYGYGYQNMDLALAKSFQITERVKVELRGEAFNVWNWHCFSQPGTFTTDVNSPSFGDWTGTITAPRSLQVGAHLTF